MPNNAEIKAGNFFFFRGSKYRIENVDIGQGKVEALESATWKRITFTSHELFGEEDGFIVAETIEELDRQISLWQPLVEPINSLDLPESFLQRGRKVIDTVETVDELLEQAEAEAIKRGHKFKQTPALEVALKRLDDPVSMTTYYDYRELYKSHSGNLTNIAASFRRQTFNKLRVSKVQLHLVDMLIWQYYAGSSRRSKSEIIRIINSVLERTEGLWPHPDRCEGAVPRNLIEDLLNDKIPMDAIRDNPDYRHMLVEIECPSDRWLYKYLKYFENLPDAGKQVITSRYGEEEWEARYMVYESFIHHAGRILQYVFADHWLTDLFVLDDEDKPVRLWLTLLIDGYSRSIVGFSLSTQFPSIESIQDALYHSIWPKTSHKALGIEEEWPVYGIPQHLSLDNAWAHHSHSLEDLARSISNNGQYPNIFLDFRPPYKGRYGALIERLFGNFSEQMKQMLPGAIQSSDYKDIANAKKKARLLADDLNRYVHELILRYQHTSHSGIGGMTPHEKWMEGAEMVLPKVPNLTTGTKRLFWRMDPKTRKITSKGISAFGMSYWSPAMDGAERIDINGRKVEYSVRYDTHDIGVLAVFRDGHYIADVQAKELLLPDNSRLKLSLTERKMAQQLAKDAGQSARDWLRFINRWEDLSAQRKKELSARKKQAKKNLADQPSDKAVDEARDRLQNRGDTYQHYDELFND